MILLFMPFLPKRSFLSSTFFGFLKLFVPKTVVTSLKEDWKILKNVNASLPYAYENKNENVVMGDYDRYHFSKVLILFCRRWRKILRPC